jgi:hypothetical protein
MINNMSWQGYWTFMSITIAIYYLFVAVLFYSGDLKRWYEGNGLSKLGLLLKQHGKGLPWKVVPAQQQTSFEGIIAETAAIENEQESLPTAVQSLVDEIQAFMTGAADEHLSRRIILDSLPPLLKKYPGMEHSPYRPAIDEIIQFTSENICSIHLSADDVECVWKG